MKAVDLSRSIATCCGSIGAGPVSPKISISLSEW
ncbi:MULTISPECIES: hypothetical protein [unclassified Microbacterium]